MKEATLAELASAVADNPIGYLLRKLGAGVIVSFQSMGDRIALEACEQRALADQPQGDPYAQVVLTTLDEAGLLDSAQAQAAARLAAQRLAQAANDPDAGK